MPKHEAQLVLQLTLNLSLHREKRGHSVIAIREKLKPFDKVDDLVAISNYICVFGMCISVVCSWRFTWILQACTDYSFCLKRTR